MRPFAPADGHYFRGRDGDLVPSETAVVKNVIVGFEDAVCHSASRIDRKIFSHSGPDEGPARLSSGD